MSVNSSSNSSLPAVIECIYTTKRTYIFTALLFTYYLLLPLFIRVLYVGFHQWRRQRSVATAATASHTDIFTFNMVVMDLISILGYSLYCYGTYFYQASTVTAGLYMFAISVPGQTLFHLLTCVERYLAVVHPVTYLGLKQAGGVRIRNISIGCVWLCCFAWMGVNGTVNRYIISNIALMLIAFIAVSFCSLSVLCVLIRPGPGDVGGNRERVDQSKLRAFHTITAIMGTLLLMFLSSLVSTVIYASSVSSSGNCLVMSSAVWFSVPSTLVLPLLFLHRAGKLPGCKHNTQSV